jgi:hypothetical protein
MRLDEGHTGTVSKAQFEEVLRRFMIDILDPEFKILYTSLDLEARGRIKYQGTVAVPCFP